MRKLSELEGAVLGVIARAQPLTPYHVRKIFARSPNPHWSASAGSIYPLIKRLEESRLLSAKDHATGERKSQKYSVTNTGRKRLRAWILGGDHVKIIGLPDLLRLRVTMLGSLTPEEQRQFLDEMERKLVEELRKIGADVERRQKEDLHSFVAARGALLQTEARLVWIREVQARLFGASRPA